MAQSSDVINDQHPPRRLASARGDGVALAAGGTFACAIALTVVACAYWGLSARRDAALAARREELRDVSRVFAAGVREALTAGHGEGLRTLVSDAVEAARLESCRVSTPSGTVLADNSGKSGASIPEQWGETARTAEPVTERTEPAVDGERFTVTTPMVIPGRGPAIAEASAIVAVPLLARGPAVSGLALAAAAGAVAWFVAYRVVSRRFRALGAIQEALRGSARTQSGAPALRLGADLGLAALAWNKLISEYEMLRQQSLVRELDAGGPGVAGGSVEGSLGAACDAMWQGLLLVDDRLGVRYCNGAAAVLLRCRREELGGADIRKFVGDLNVLSNLQATVTGRARLKTTVETKVEPKHAGPGAGAPTVLRFGIKPVRTERGGAAVVVIEDVTQQRVADESRNAFVAQATHELRTPLTSIRLYVETMVDEGEKDPAVRSKCINVIGQEARRLERIVGDMLSVAEIEAGSLKLRRGDVRLDALLDELRDDYRAQAEDREITLTFELPPKLPVIQGDRDKLALCVHNLLANAIKYTPSGGKVNLAVKEEDGRLLVAVTDNGIGIRPEEQDLIFDRFYRSKDKRLNGITGSGLGLTLAREVARMHGGDITVVSEIDKGSTFTLAIPIVEMPAAAQAA